MNNIKIYADYAELTITSPTHGTHVTKIDIAELCIIKSILEKPKRLDSVLDIVDASMFEIHRNE